MDKWKYFLLSLIFTAAICVNLSKGQTDQEISLNAHDNLSTIDTLFASELMEKSLTFFEQRKYEEAIISAEIAKKIYIDILGASQKTANAYALMGRINFVTSMYKDAISNFKNALDIALKIYDEPHNEVARHFYNVGATFDKLLEYDSALVYKKRALEIRTSLFGENHADVLSILNAIGVTYKSMGEDKTALKYYLKVLHIAEEILEVDHPQFAILYYNIGAIYANRGENHKALESYKNSLRINEKRKEEIAFYDYWILQSSSFNSIGALFYDKNDYERALEFYFEALNANKKLYPEFDRNIIPLFNNIGNTYDRLGYYEKALDYKLLALKSIGDDGSPSLSATLYNNIGVTYNYIGDYQKSLEYSFKSLGLGRKNKDIERIALANHAIGNVYADLTLYDTALVFHKKSLYDWKLTHGEYHPFLAANYSDIGMCYLYKESYIMALDYFHKGLNSIRYDSDQQVEIYNIDYLLKLLGGIGFANKELFILHQDNERLAKSYEYYKQTLNVLDHVSNKQLIKQRFNFNSNTNEYYAEALTTNLLFYQHTESTDYLKEGFSFAERSKAFLLFEAMQENNALQISGIPRSLLQKEYDLRIDIAYYDKKRQEKEMVGKVESDTSVLNISNKLFDLKTEFETLKKQFEIDYPRYHKAKYDFSTVEVGYVQDHILNTNQSLLEYLAGDSSIFIFLIQKDTFEVHEIKHDFPLADWVRKMTKDGIYGYYVLSDYDPLKTKTKRDTCEVNYTEAAQQLYQKLLAPVAGRLTENLIIIPDGVLGYVPFEALLSGKPNKIGRFGDYPFMVKDHQVSYCYSATLLKEMRDKQHRGQPSGQLLAMAPFYDGDVSKLTARIDSTDLLAAFTNRDSLGTLPGSGEEVAAVNKLWNGKSIIGDGASLAEFQQHATDYRILHLSTHGKADDRVGDYAYLAFGVPGHRDEFDKLYARDLYNYSLNADLVVLSACETGIGKLQRGEGIVSLARAFAYAGAKSIFPTLWQVNDAKTKELMIGFHTYLKMGKPKDEALRLAKLDFLEKYKGQGGNDHPFFWAGMIGIGDMGAVE